MNEKQKKTINKINKLLPTPLVFKKNNKDYIFEIQSNKYFNNSILIDINGNILNFYDHGGISMSYDLDMTFDDLIKKLKFRNFK